MDNQAKQSRFPRVALDPGALQIEARRREALCAAARRAIRDGDEDRRARIIRALELAA